jgi:hypothetical protein
MDFLLGLFDRILAVKGDDFPCPLYHRLLQCGRLHDVYSDAAGVLSEEEIAAVEWIGITINAWNRMSIASRPFVRP